MCYLLTDDVTLSASYFKFSIKMNCIPPHFICIGAQRSGTSWMFECFLEHPDIFLPGKELHFFDREPVSKIEEYRAKFANTDKVCGEITPDYLSSTEAVDKIASTCPNSKIIVILRNPVERTQSSFLLYKERGVISDSCLQDVFQNRSAPFLKSLYGEQIQHLYTVIPAERIKVVFFDRIKTDPVGLIQELYEFIGVDPTFEPASATRNFNASSIGFGSNRLAKFITHTQNYLVHRSWGKFLLRFKKTDWFKRFKNNLIAKRQQSEASGNAAKYYSYFADDITKLENQIGQSVPDSWKAE